jgi:hypothetical protein
MVRAAFEDGYKPFISLDLASQDGRRRTVRCNVDTGGGGRFQLASDIATELGLRDGDEVRAFIGNEELALGVPIHIIERRLGQAQIGPRTLSRFRAVFDFPGGWLELLPPDSRGVEGTRLEMPFVDEMRYPWIEVEVDGISHGFLLDTGAMFTMVSEKQIARWHTSHPDWRYEIGARGDAVMGVGGEDTLPMLWLPELRWGSFVFTDVGVVGRREGVFEEFMSQWMPSPIVGALGNNVLRELRLELDYVEQAVFVTRP